MFSGTVPIGRLMLGAGLAAVSCSAPQEGAAPPVAHTVASPGDKSSKWVLTFRYTSIDESKNPVGDRPSFESKTPYDVLCWARFNRKVPVRAGGEALESFRILVSGLTEPEEVGEEEIGDAMHGALALKEAGDCTMEIRTDEDYVIEIYSPSKPESRPADSPPIPKPTAAEKEDFSDEQKLQNQDWPAEKLALDKHVNNIVKSAQIAPGVKPSSR